VRKALWRRQKLKGDSDYRENQKAACKRWRQKNPRYWKLYRGLHPSYTEENRRQQRHRKFSLSKGPEPPDCSEASQVANSDALCAKNPVKAGMYQLVPLPYDGFANSDALIVKISVIPKGYQQMGEVCKHTTL
jgi:hypothetical protein